MPTLGASTHGDYENKEINSFAAKNNHSPQEPTLICNVNVLMKLNIVMMYWTQQTK